ncbi:pyridoxal phosphate-dependent aminotransferase [Granulicella cerasi]|uniref:Aminotransferase n=1 Tax=Granulicella cerasi TaxID=741063 RepID=A0ABW1ZAN2_9BACT|nr:pyridoxal phosphate-dependent aminotransferase [Granulicella cerasi]
MSTNPAQNPLMKALAARINEEDTSYRTKMVEIAAKLQDVIAMGRGDPDFRTPEHIAEAARQAITDDRTHYTHPAGIPELREAVSSMLKAEYKLDYTTEEIIVTAGVQEAMMLCMLALINEGDEVLIPSPRFTSYDTAVHMCGGKIVPVPTREETNFALMPADVEARITPRTKVLVLVTPNNPTGAVTEPEQVRELAEIAKKHNLIVISDEIYAKIIFDGSEHLSIGSLPGMKERTITLNGFSKSYAMTGFRVGYLAAPADFVQMLIEPRHTLSINATTPSQWAALAALTGPQDDSIAMFEAYRDRRDYMMKALDEVGFTYGHPGGAFYIYANVEKSGLAAPEFCELLLRECRVLLFPGTLFGDEDTRYVRMSLLQPIERMQEAMDRIIAAKERLFVHAK